jgi:hypothetical protein
LLQDYFDRYLAELDALFAAGPERLMRYWQTWLDKQVDACAEQKCMVVKLGGRWPISPMPCGSPCAMADRSCSALPA